jgi:hypothetical protein
VILINAMLLSVVLAASPATASADLREDICAATPTMVAEVDPADGDGVPSPLFVNGYVWYGGSIYLPDGTFVRTAPADGYLRGEIIEFNAGIVDPSQAEWGVVGLDRQEGYRVYSPDGLFLVDIPTTGALQAAYDDGYILAAETVRLGPDPLSAFLIDESKTVIELPASSVEETDRFGGVAGETVFLIESDRSLGLFDTSGNRLGSRRGPNGADIAEVFSAHGHSYALTDPYGEGHVSLMVFDGTGDLVNTVEFEPGLVNMRPTDSGLAYEFRTRSIEELEQGPTEVIGDPRFGLLTPTGHSVADLDIADDSEDRILKAHGRYLMVEDFDSRWYPPDDELANPTQTSRIRTFLLDGTPVATTAEITRSEYVSARPAGTLVAHAGADGHSVEFRDLEGQLLGSQDLELGTFTSIELMTTDDEYLWVETSWATGTYPDFEEFNKARVYDLGPCAGRPSPGTFIDDDRSVFEADIEWLASESITQGCDPAKGGTRFCPDQPITRGQMAAFFHRALGDELPMGVPASFTDTTGSVFAADIAWLSATGISRGCTADRFCPDDPVTRGQMAAFLARAFGLEPAPPADFDDTSQSVFADDISRIAGSGITRGCTATSFCPNDPVTRGQMAALFRRALTG